MSRHLLTCGEHAVLVELDGLEDVLALDDAVRAAVGSGDVGFADLVDVVPAARTLLVMVREGADLAPVRAALTTLALPAHAPRGAEAFAPSGPADGSGQTPQRSGDVGQPGNVSKAGIDSKAEDSREDRGHQDRRHVVEILVHYDGPDLEEVSRLTGLTVDEVVASHTGTPWRVAFAGFSPGFAYLTGGDSRLQVPRRSEPRTSVPAGSVGLAGEFSAVYPRSSPGGWQLLGHTDEVLWDVDRRSPALLQPGTTVRFVNMDALR